MPYILGIETTCDETSAALFTDEPTIISNIVASQSSLHARYGGVVPEIASRSHLERILPVIDQALTSASLTLRDLDAVAVAHTPGLVGSILVGLSAAKALSAALGIPLIGINHIEGHIYACQLDSEVSVFPCIGLVVSGGHTNLFHCRTPSEFELIGCTTDDAAGEAFDKVASMLKLGYPGGPAIEKAARTGNPKAYDFPRTYINQDVLDFSFSGLKTAVLYAVHGQNARERDRVLTQEETADVAASFQQAVVDVLVSKIELAARQKRVDTLCVGGGVAANSSLREALDDLARRRKLRVHVPPIHLCTDNAALACVAVEKWRRRQFESLDLDAIPGLVRKK